METMESDPQNDPRWAAQRLAAVGSIAALVGHEARNRLTVVRAALELLEADLAGDLTAEQRTAFLGELDRFLGDFNLGLDMIRCHASGAKPVSVRILIADAVARCRQQVERAGISLNFADQPKEDLVSADSLLLRQAMLNLLRNAIEALEGRPGGRIIVRSIAGDPWLIEVEDNGPGLPAEMREDAAALIFPPPGLGLALCRDAMTVMGGSVSYVTSQQEAGARFQLSLPRTS
jgi:signal transduction histidine kinase